MQFITSEYNEKINRGIVLCRQDAGYRNILFSKNKIVNDRYYLKFPKMYYRICYAICDIFNCHDLPQSIIDPNRPREFVGLSLSVSFFDSKSKKHFLVPLPNIYTNSKVCMGDDCHNANHNVDLQQLCRNFISFFWASQFDICEIYGVCKLFYDMGLFPSINRNHYCYDGCIKFSYSKYLKDWQENKANIFLAKGFFLEDWLNLTLLDPPNYSFFE
jgi:hypothetical protein